MNRNRGEPHMKTYPRNNKRKIRKEEASRPSLLRHAPFLGRGIPALVAAMLVFCMVAGNAVANPVYNFTNAGTTGRNGPTQSQVNSAYSGGNQSTVSVAVVPFRGIGTVSVQPLTGKPSQ